MIIRKFLPIGQGAFYYEKFKHLAKEDINIIYDCGSSTSQKILEKQINVNFYKGETIQAFFISHLDEDHINGLPYLLQHCNVKKIFFPLITEKNSKYINVYDLIHNKDISLQNSFAFNFRVNPKETISALKLGYMPELYEVLPYEENYNQNIKKERENLIVSGNDLFTMLIDESENNEFDWHFITFNFNERKRVHKLEKEISIEFGIPVALIDIEDLYKQWPKEIKGCYKKVEGNLNTNSMVLYSGPQKREKMQWLISNKSKNSDYITCLMSKKDLLKPAGCLYMGDYDARGLLKWKDLYNAYKVYWNNIGCLQIPHHGSKHNYNTTIGDMNVFHIISAGISNPYRHPNVEVIRDLLKKDKNPYTVTENRESEITILIKI